MQLRQQFTLKKADKKLIVHHYDAVHDFANSNSPKHNEAGTKMPVLIPCSIEGKNKTDYAKSN